MPAENESLRIGVMARLRAYMLAGTLVTAPLAITFYLAYLFITFVDDRVNPLIPTRYNPETYLPFSIPGLGLVIVLTALILIGWLTAGVLGRLFQRISERILARTPVIRNIYGAIKQILETVLAQKSNAFREAVLIEYPRQGVWTIAFITGHTQGEIRGISDEEVINVYVPTTPNPTSGFLLFVPRKDVVSLSMSVEEAFKMVISGGIVTPPDRRPPHLRQAQIVPPVAMAEAASKKQSSSS
jgi:uncharacterized membrane protein